MAKLVKKYEYIVDLNSARLDLSFWLDDIFKKYEFYKHSPEIIMGVQTFETFKSIIERIELDTMFKRIYMFKGYTILQEWITIDHTVHPYYISIKWEEESEAKISRDLYGLSIQRVFYDEFFGLDRGHGFQKVPHIDHVKFNGPATIVFWKDGTKTVVKHDGKGRKDKRLAILYAFIRKIYGEGKPYNNILNEIERVIK